MTAAPLQKALSDSAAARHARSWLLVSAQRLDEPALTTSVADQIVLDLEDAVDVPGKPVARRRVAEWLSAQGEAWVRINDATTPFWRDDIAELRGLPGLRGVILAKTECARHVEQTFSHFEGVTPVIALIESARGIEFASEIARADGAFRLAFGSGDYRRDTGAGTADLAMAYPRSRLVVASRVGDLPGPIDGPPVPGGASIHEQSALSSELGMTGKLCLHREHLADINAAMAPSHEEVAWAHAFLRDFAAAGGVIRDGSDLPRLGRARKVEELGHLFGVTPASGHGTNRLGY